MPLPPATPPVALDTETHLLDAGLLAPPIVCLTYSHKESRALHAVGDGREKLHDAIVAYLQLPALVFHNAPFDLAVFAANFPDTLPLIFKALDEGRVHDTLIRETLLHLTSHGNLEYEDIQGNNRPIKYDLASLAWKHLGKDITKGKEAQDAWRLNYKHLEGTPASQWPPEAVDYAISDAVHTEAIFHVQEIRRAQVAAKMGHDPFKTESFQNAVGFALQLMACQGFLVDAEEVAKVEAIVAEARRPEKMMLLVEHGILIPGRPPEPYLNGAIDKETGLPKMKKAVKESISKSALVAHASALAAKHDLTLNYTDPSDTFPKGQISVDGDWVDEHKHLCPVLREYSARIELDKLVTTYIPALKFKSGEFLGQVSPIVHGQYETIKKTGRTSSRASKIFPSFNVQNQDPRIRGCMVARPGRIMCSTDYGSLELCTFAQKCLNLFGKSKLADILNAGICPHEYLGAQIAYEAEPGWAASIGTGLPDMAVYEAFHVLKAFPQYSPEKEFWKQYRTMAKPVGLGLPGGLGAKTLVSTAASTYGVIFTEEQAHKLIALWKRTLPEAQLYFDWIKGECKDRINGPKSKEVIRDGVKKIIQQDVYCYTSPFGLFRAGADYCAAANGAGLQAFAADGAKLAVYNTVKECYIGSLQGLVYPLAFIHDEILIEIVDDGDREMVQACANRVAEIMVEAMRVVCPGVRISASPCLMKRWNKLAEPVFDKDGFLAVWEPKAA